jgi:protease I
MALWKAVIPPSIQLSLRRGRTSTWKQHPGGGETGPPETLSKALGTGRSGALYIGEREGTMELKGKHVAVLAEDLYEDLELWYPVYRFREAGAKVTIVGGGASGYSSKHGYPVTPDASADKVKAADIDAVIIPGGYAPDRMRRHKAMVDVLRGRKATGFFAIKDDLVNAGARYEDREVVRDGNLVTSRKPEDLPAFCRTIFQAISGAKE